MRAVVEVEENQKGATILVVTELPYQVNPDNLDGFDRRPQLREGRIAGIAEHPRRELRTASGHADGHHAEAATRWPRWC